MMRRTTLSAEAADLRVLEAEARARGVSLAQVLREVIAEAATKRRAERPRRRFGVFDGGGRPIAQLSADHEDAPAQGSGS